MFVPPSPQCSIVHVEFVLRSYCQSVIFIRYLCCVSRFRPVEQIEATIMQSPHTQGMRKNLNAWHSLLNRVARVTQTPIGGDNFVDIGIGIDTAFCVF